MRLNQNPSLIPSQSFRARSETTLTALKPSSSSQIIDVSEELKAFLEELRLTAGEEHFTFSQLNHTRF